MINKIKKTANGLFLKIKNNIESRKAEGYIDTVVKIIIAVVIGTVLLTSLYYIYTGVVDPTLTSKITGLFAYDPG